MQLDLDLYKPTFSSLLTELLVDTSNPRLGKEAIFKVHAECAVELSNLACCIGRHRELTLPEIRVVQRYGAKHYVDYEGRSGLVFKQENIRDTIADYRIFGVPLICDTDIETMERIERDG